MLQHLHIQNLAIVESLELEFETGFCALTGETGAGKSIWVDAINLALGQRADTSCIRSGQTRCDITLTYDSSNNVAAQHWLQAHDFAQDDECIIRRTINQKGSSRLTINGIPCPQQLVREFADKITHIHGQHEQQGLFKTAKQRTCLDTIAQNETLLDEIEKLYQNWRATQSELDMLQAKAEQRDAELALLQYQLNELAQLNLQENEWQTVSNKHRQMHNAKHLMQQLSQAIELTVEDDKHSASQLLQQAIDRLTEIKIEDTQIEVIKELLNTASIHLQEAGDELNHYRDHLDLSPENLATIEERMTAMHDLARKHHVNPEDLTDVIESLQQKINNLENIDNSIASHQQIQATRLQQYTRLADKLTQQRNTTANALNKAISKYMQQLGIEGGEFKVEMHTVTQTMNRTGNEDITFLIRTNPKQPLQPMNKIASGGELSRINLALQLMMAQKKQTPTLIFDEVDVGIGGKTAHTVGKLLRELGEQTQVLCITHLPQVAALAHHHFKVAKKSTKQGTQTQIVLLNQQERAEELARMLGGEKITKQTLAHAQELLCVN